MKKLVLLVFFCLYVLSSCGIQEAREEAKKEDLRDEIREVCENFDFEFYTRHFLSDQNLLNSNSVRKLYNFYTEQGRSTSAKNKEIQALMWERRKLKDNFVFPLSRYCIKDLEEEFGLF